MEHILVGMSGGVDSSVAALILQRQGCAVTGVTLRLRGGRLAASTGAGVQRDIDDARRVCEALGIEHRVLDLTDAFCRCVVDEFAAEYLAGRTPNPCVTCNRTIKFGAMLDYALENGMDGVATGPLRPPGIRRRRRPLGPVPCRFSQGSELCPLWPEPGAAGPRPLPPMGLWEGRSARPGSGGLPARGR